MPRLRVTILAVLLAGALVGCNAAPTVTPSTTPTAGVTTMPTASPSSTPEPTPTPALPALSRAAADLIGVGLRGYVVFQLTSTPYTVYSHFIKACAIKEGGNISFVYNQDSEDGGISSFTITDRNGTRTVDAIPDPKPVPDFGITKGDFSMYLDGTVSATELISAFGSPSSDNTEDRNAEGFGNIRLRTIQFSYLSVLLYQQQSTTTPDSWSLWTATATAADIATPRGLKVGLDVKEVVDLLGTGDFGYYIDTYPDITQMYIVKKDAAPEVEYESMTLGFKDGKISAIEMDFLAP